MLALDMTCYVNLLHLGQQLFFPPENLDGIVTQIIVPYYYHHHHPLPSHSHWSMWLQQFLVITLSIACLMELTASFYLSDFSHMCFYYK